MSSLLLSSPVTDNNIVQEGGNRLRLSAVRYDLRRMKYNEILSGAEYIVPFPLPYASPLTSAAALGGGLVWAAEALASRQKYWR